MPLLQSSFARTWTFPYRFPLEPFFWGFIFWGLIWLTYCYQVSVSSPGRNSFDLLPTLIIITLRQVKHKLSYMALLIFSSGSVAINLRSVDKLFPEGRGLLHSQNVLRSPSPGVFGDNVGPRWIGLNLRMHGWTIASSRTPHRSSAMYVKQSNLYQKGTNQFFPRI